MTIENYIRGNTTEVKTNLPKHLYKMSPAPTTTKNSIKNKNYHNFKHSHEYIRNFANDCTGNVLEIGCGQKPYAEWFSNADSYIGLDVTTAEKNVDVLGNGTMLPFKDNSFDAVASFQVLEHISDPQVFIKEMGRVLNVDGRGIILTNQSWPLHEVPHDYFRFTRFGLDHLADAAGLDVVEHIEIGDTLMQAVLQTNYAFENYLPNPVSTGSIIALNLLFIPLEDLYPREDYFKTGIIFEFS